MKYQFNLILEGPLTEDAVARLSQAGCSDMTFGLDGGVPYASVNREANSLEEAQVSAREQINNSGAGLRVIDPLPLPEKEEKE